MESRVDHQTTTISSSGGVSPIDAITPSTKSAARVLELVQKYGRGYANGELDHVGRGKCLTGSEIPAICGENMFERANSVLFRKAFGVKTPDSPATEYGRATEPIAIGKFEKNMGARVFYVGFMVHEKYDFIGGTFDALALMPDGEGVLIEVKCPYTRSIGSRIPEHYVGQVQTYLEIAGLDTCLFVQYKPSYTTPKRGIHRGEKLSITRVPRDPAYFARRMGLLWGFWRRLSIFREVMLPIADIAARSIQWWWREKRGDNQRCVVQRVLCLHAFKVGRMNSVNRKKIVEESIPVMRPDLIQFGATCASRTISVVLESFAQ